MTILYFNLIVADDYIDRSFEILINKGAIIVRAAIMVCGFSRCSTARWRFRRAENRFSASDIILYIYTIVSNFQEARDVFFSLSPAVIVQLFTFK